MRYRPFNLVTAFVSVVAATDSSSSAAASSSSTSASRELKGQRGALLGQGNRRHMVQDVRVRVEPENIDYGPTEDHPKYGYSETRLVAILPQDLRIGLQTNVSHLELVDFNDQLLNEVSRMVLNEGGRNGGTDSAGFSSCSISSSSAVVDLEEGFLYMPPPPDSIVECEDDTANGRKLSRKKSSRGSPVHRRLAASRGNLRTLAIRVTDASGNSPSADASQLSSDIFTDSFSLKTGYSQCSYDDLTIVPTGGNTLHDGIYELHLPKYTVSPSGRDRTGLQSAAMEAAVTDIENIEKMYDLVLFCMPGNSGVWQAYSFVDDMYSFYNDGWCESSSALMHQVGHNLNLAHSGTPESEYDDRSGLMGYSSQEDDTRMCFNPAKTWQLGWFRNEGATESIRPEAEKDLPNGFRDFVLGGIADYRTHPNRLVVLRLNQVEPHTVLENIKKEDGTSVQVKRHFNQDYYIGYNKATGINADVVANRNEVVIIKKIEGEPGEIGQSIKEASLPLGDSYTIKGWNGNPDLKFRIEFAAQMEDYALIEIRDLARFPIPIKEEPPVPCDDYEIEFKTDGWPLENSWMIVNNATGRLAHRGPKYTQANTLHNELVCLPYSQCYKFIFVDEYGDGICCGEGNGYYKAFQKSPRSKIFESSDEEFTRATKDFCVRDDPKTLG